MSVVLGDGVVLDGRYRLRKPLGSGSFGEVWEAEDQRLLGRPVAVKVLHSGLSTVGSFEERFQQEIRALASVSHPNVVHISDAGAWEGRRFLVVELVRGRPLSAWLADHGPGRLPPIASVRRVFARCAAGMAAAHAAGVVHRDLKPDNIMIVAHDGELGVKILDFGLALLTSHRITRDATRIGSELYMSPEQFLGNARAICPATDVFALAVLLLELLTLDAFGPEGKLWWSVSWLDEVDVAALKAASRPDVPPALWALLTRALDKNPATRPADAASLAAAVEAAFNNLPLAPPPPRPAPAPPAAAPASLAVDPTAPTVAIAAMAPAAAPAPQPPAAAAAPRKKPAVFYRPPTESARPPQPRPPQPAESTDPNGLRLDERCRVWVLQGKLELAIMGLEGFGIEQGASRAGQAQLWCGDLLAEVGRHNEAREAYGRASDLVPALGDRVRGRLEDLALDRPRVSSQIVALVDKDAISRLAEVRADQLYRAARLGRRHGLPEGTGLLHEAYRLDPMHHDAPLYESWMIAEGDADGLAHTQTQILDALPRSSRPARIALMTLCWRSIRPDPAIVKVLRVMG